MNDQALQALQAFAVSLHTTAEHLWAVLLRQAPIWAVSVSWTWAVGGVIVYSLLRFAYARKRFLEAEIAAERRAEDDMFPIISMLVFGWTGLALVSLFFLFGVPMVFTAIFNPEYWALEQILEILRK